MLDLSVIIPIYNTPTPDLQRCFASVLELDPIAYEVLLIDDGSETRIGELCTEFTSKHPNFRYIHKANGGVSSARNLGISQAKGRYLTFLDADDRIIGKSIAQHIPADNFQDLVIFDMLLTQRGQDNVWPAFNLPQGILDRQQVLYQLCTASSISGPVAKLYKTQFLQERNLQFNPEFIAGEDWMFVCDYIMQAQHFLYQKECAYQYFREASTSQSRFARFPDKMLSNQLDRYARKQQVMEQQQWTMYSAEKLQSLAAVELIENLFNSASDLLMLKKLTPERKSRIFLAVSRARTRLDNSVGKKTRLKLFILLKFPIALWPMAKMRQLYLRNRG